MFESAALAILRQRYASLFTSDIDTVRSFAPSRTIWGFPTTSNIFQILYCIMFSNIIQIDCLSFMNINMIAIVGTSDQSCWLAETCELLLFRARVPCQAHTHVFSSKAGGCCTTTAMSLRLLLTVKTFACSIKGRICWPAQMVYLSAMRCALLAYTQQALCCLLCYAMLCYAMLFMLSKPKPSPFPGYCDATLEGMTFLFYELIHHSYDCCFMAQQASSDAAIQASSDAAIM